MGELDLWDVYGDLVRAEVPEDQVLGRLCQASLLFLQQSSETNEIDRILENFAARDLSEGVKRE